MKSSYQSDRLLQHRGISRAREHNVLKGTTSKVSQFMQGIV